jgi:hypothetical protein
MRRHAGVTADGADAAESAFQLGEVAVGLAVILVLVVFVAPLLVAIVDIVVLLAIAGVGLIGRIVFRRPWTVEARADDGTMLRWQVIGWRASGEFRARAAESLRAGVIPPGATTVDVPGVPEA